MADTSVIFNILAKDKTGKVFDDIKGKLAVAFGTGALIAFGKQAVESASNLAETQSKVTQLFGDSSAAVNAFAVKAATSMGQSQQSALDAAATFAIMGKSAGLTGEHLLDFSTDFTTLASDLASFNNTSPEQAIEAIGAALRGESEPIRAYGVLLDDVSLKAQALQMGLLKGTTSIAQIKAAQLTAIEAQKKYNQAVKEHGSSSAEAQKANVALGLAQERLQKATEGTTGSLTPQQRILAAQALIYQQTGAAQGDFARTSGGLANQQRIMAAEVENAKAKLGAGLLPVVLQVMHALVPFVEFISRNTGWILPLVGGIAAIVGVIKIWTAVQWLLNFALTANPIGLIIVGIAALIAIIVLIATKTTWFQTIWAAVWGYLKGIGAWFAGPFANFFVTAWNVIVNGVKGVYRWVTDRLSAIVGFVTSLPGKIGAAAKNMWTGLVNTARAAFNVLIRAWNSLDFGIHINIPSWVPGIGGRGININDIIPDIPMLAKGAVVTGPTLAMLGEGGHPERVQPLDGSEKGVTEVRLVVDFRGGDDEMKRLFMKWLRIDAGFRATVRSSVTV